MTDARHERARRQLLVLTGLAILASLIFAATRVLFYVLISSLGDVPAEELVLLRGYALMAVVGVLFQMACGAWVAMRPAAGERYATFFVIGNLVFLYACTAVVIRIYGGFFTMMILPAAFTLVAIAALVAGVVGTLGVAFTAAAGYIALILTCERAGWLPHTPLGFTIGGAGFLLLSGCLIAALAWQKSRNERDVMKLEAAAERARIIEIFGQQVSPAVVDKLLAQKGTPASESRAVCIMFLDIRGFTSFSESKTPDEVVRYLNSLWDFMVDAVNRNHGIVNKFLGDGFMATFGAPLAEGDHCENALKASREIIEETERAVASGRIPPTKIGIGLHAGTAVTGNVGSALRKEYSVIGDVVNLASRIESMNKELGSALLASADVVGESPAADATSIGAKKIRGHEKDIELFRLR